LGKENRFFSQAIQSVSKASLHDYLLDTMIVSYLLIIKIIVSVVDYFLLLKVSYVQVLQVGLGIPRQNTGDFTWVQDYQLVNRRWLKINISPVPRNKIINQPRSLAIKQPSK
jgi:hypothetical protein